MIPTEALTNLHKNKLVARAARFCEDKDDGISESMWIPTSSVMSVVITAMKSLNQNRYLVNPIGYADKSLFDVFGMCHLISISPAPYNDLRDLTDFYHYQSIHDDDKISTETMTDNELVDAIFDPDDGDRFNVTC
ncbi:hypothetical protein [uncultured Limosilactobacillus sp.]|uniref:hypothetical protein n=1 Tax=uncultured Limosilactobacillus sp. TaxID=2837629 RepID=UPI0025DFAE5F|nr:hypothetical protein [uncultured Limosilactobacillus sp.]